jgi:non-heme chloroperoxidase
MRDMRRRCVSQGRDAEYLSGYPHGMLTIHADVINPDLLAFVRG